MIDGKNMNEEMRPEIPEREPERQYYFMELAKGFLSEYSERLKHPATYHITTFGCQMNARDSEKLAGILETIGFVPGQSEETADFVIFNTCTVRDNADQRLYGRLGHLKGERYRHPERIIALCGCLMQEPTAVARIKKSYPQVDIIFGTHNIYKLAELFCLYAQEGSRVTDILPEAERIVEDIPSVRKYPFKSGVNISFGCDNFCSYCIVPYVRGRERSREPKDILREIERLTEDGVIEVMLLGQNVNSYGKGLSDPVTFPALLREIAQIEKLKRIRFMTSHPKDLSEDLIRVIRDHPKICRHLHLPLQSGSSRILTAMNRHYTKESYLALAMRLRQEIPELAITTDIIVGFPGETEADVDDTLDVIRQVQFDGAFTFIYSKRANTPAAEMPDQVPKEESRVQFDRVLSAVQEASRERAALRTGKIEEVLIEEISDHDPSYVSGRLSSNLVVHVPGGEELIGTIVRARLSECHGFYYIGERRES
ncbi:MAG: tRNA (N6-isopentenyl adenosine(37)-C2)-methylthiotransferase MiaB [Lachnospiraceae bacterium]|nr:tRNA (N6-isopentenyl adenosine(37)-C2)-methylthiotransferase MiaB [Lachnospiraceae bacterium]